MSQKGNTILISIVVLAVLVAGGWYWYSQNKSQDGDMLACPQDAKICPDGSAVGRTGPNCAFEECAKPSIAQNDIDVSTWKTYRNEEYGFEFKYPSDFFLKEQREYQDDALNPAENYTTAVFITNYPKETVRGPLANFNLTINFFRQAPESFASVVGLPLQTIILGTEVYKFVEYDEGLNYSGAGFRAKYFLATPLVKDIWITFDHLPINEGDGGDVFLVKSTGDFLDYLQQKQIARIILSTLKFLP